MHNAIELFVRQRARELGLSLSEVCRRASISRQTLYELAQVPQRLPGLTTVVTLAEVLEVHPLRLLQMIFDDVPVRTRLRESDQSDRSAFMRDVTLPDGEPMVLGQRFCKTWELQNVGRVVWEGRHLRCQDDEVVIYARNGERLNIAPSLLPDERRVPIPRTLPGETVQISAWFTAPDVPGSVLSYWKMVYADDTLCFPDNQGVWVKLRIVTATGGASSCSGRDSHPAYMA